MSALFLPTIGIITALAVSLITLIIYTLWKDERQVKKVEEEAHGILQRARLQADQLIREAEMVGLNTIQGKKTHVDHVEDVYEKNLETLTSHTLDELKKATSTIKNHYEQFVSESETIIAHHVSQNQKRLDSHLESQIKAHEAEFAHFLQKEKERISNTVQKQLYTVNELVEKYQKSRYQMVDSEIFDLVKKTTELTLKKTLTSAEHRDIVLACLEDAKQSGFFKHE